MNFITGLPEKKGREKSANLGYRQECSFAAAEKCISVGVGEEGALS